jgi:thioredoxin-like negative regulator of GroEL
MRTTAKWIAPAVFLAAISFDGPAGGALGAVEQAAVTSPHATGAPGALTTPAQAVRLRHGVFKYTSYGAAWTSAQATNRPILVFATSANCPHCVRMVGQTLQAPQVSRFVNDSFETVYVHRSEQPELAAKLRIRYFPTTIVVGPNNQVLDVIEGYVDANSFAQRLQTSVAMHQASQKR